jgi:hypothetical protein
MIRTRGAGRRRVGCSSRWRRCQSLVVEPDREGVVVGLTVHLQVGMSGWLCGYFSSSLPLVNAFKYAYAKEYTVLTHLSSDASYWDAGRVEGDRAKEGIAQRSLYVCQHALGMLLARASFYLTAPTGK